MGDLNPQTIVLMYASYCRGRYNERLQGEKQEAKKGRREQLERETLDVLMRKKAELGAGERQHIDILA